MQDDGSGRRRQLGEAGEGRVMDRLSLSVIPAGRRPGLGGVSSGVGGAASCPGGERRRRQGRSILALPLAARQCSPSVIFRPPRFPPSPAPPLPWGIQDSSCCLLGTGKGPKETMLRDSANDGQVERFIPVGCPFPCQAGGGEESTSEAEGRAFPLVCGFLPVPFLPLGAGHSSRRRWARIPV